MEAKDLEDLLDELVSEYSDLIAAGHRPNRRAWLERVEPEQRPGLERCLKMIDAGMAQVPSPTAIGPGVEFGRYKLLSELGRGGMSLVYLALDRELDRPVALKVLRPGLALEQRHVDRFRREATAIAKLRHPHIVQVFDVGEYEGHHFLSMEYVEGPTLATVLEALPSDRPWTADDLARATRIPSLAEGCANYEQAAAKLLAPVAGGLCAAHDSGLIHRDVKPSNILLHRDGRAVIADFGLAKGENDPALSLTGDTLGTPYYMSPEQAYSAENAVDHRTDIYSLGVTLFETLSGRRPFEGQNLFEIIEAIRSGPAPNLANVTTERTPAAVATTMQAMAKDPQERYGDMRAFHEDLQLLAQGLPTRARGQSLGGVLRSMCCARTRGRNGFEYRSARSFLGWPLLHVNVGPPRLGKPTFRRAKGWLAIGDVAMGGVAIGNVGAVGGVALAGAASAGGICFSGAAALGILLGLAGGFATGVYALAGGAAVGLIAIAGGYARGYAALSGGYSHGTYAIGNKATGEYIIDATVRNPEALEFLQTWLPFSDYFLRNFN